MGLVVVSWVGGDLRYVFDYWLGVFVGSMKCVCGVNRMCVNLGFVCNCDIGDEKWREDEGRF